MINVNITTTDGTVAVTSPYNGNFVVSARNLGGRWNAAAKAWEFDSRDEGDVRSLCLEIYGTDGSPVETCTLKISFPEGAYAQTDSLAVAGRVIARAWGRDSGAKLGDGVRLIEGKFSSGGSRKNWDTNAARGTIVLVRDFPRPMAERIVSEGFGDIEENLRHCHAEIIEEGNGSVDRAALEAERERLLARLAEIEKALA